MPAIARIPLQAELGITVQGLVVAILAHGQQGPASEQARPYGFTARSGDSPESGGALSNMLNTIRDTSSLSLPATLRVAWLRSLRATAHHRDYTAGSHQRSKPGYDQQFHQSRP
jgi:hypothetical protein